MQWNYRIVSEQAPEGEFLQLYEVYYDDGKIIGMLENPSKPQGMLCVFEPIELTIPYTQTQT